MNTTIRRMLYVASFVVCVTVAAQAKIFIKSLPISNDLLQTLLAHVSSLVTMLILGYIAWEIVNSIMRHLETRQEKPPLWQQELKEQQRIRNLPPWL